MFWIPTEKDLHYLYYKWNMYSLQKTWVSANVSIIRIWSDLISKVIKLNEWWCSLIRPFIILAHSAFLKANDTSVFSVFIAVVVFLTYTTVRNTAYQKVYKVGKRLLLKLITTLWWAIWTLLHLHKTQTEFVKSFRLRTQGCFCAFIIDNWCLDNSKEQKSSDTETPLTSVGELNFCKLLPKLRCQGAQNTMMQIQTLCS